MHRDELKDKRLDAACCFESEPLHVKPRHDEFLEVALLLLDYKTVCPPFPFPNKNGVQFKPNCSIIEKIPPKGESFADFIAAFAMSVGFDTYFICNTKIGEKSDRIKSRATFCSSGAYK